MAPNRITVCRWLGLDIKCRPSQSIHRQAINLIERNRQMISFCSSATLLSVVAFTLIIMTRTWRIYLFPNPWLFWQTSARLAPRKYNLSDEWYQNIFYRLLFFFPDDDGSIHTTFVQAHVIRVYYSLAGCVATLIWLLAPHNCRSWRGGGGALDGRLMMIREQ